jgi:hypothetical protein
MENNNQRIVFIVPEGTSSADIVLNIFKKNGLKDYNSDDSSDADDEEMLNVLTTVSGVTRDFFDKKISEQEAIKILTDQLKIPLDKATNIMKDIENELIPFTKKITVKEETEEAKPITAMPVRLIDENKKQNAVIEKPIKEEVPAPTKEHPKAKTVISHQETTKKEPPANFPKKPDNYREPIE